MPLSDRIKEGSDHFICRLLMKKLAAWISLILVDILLLFPGIASADQQLKLENPVEYIIGAGDLLEILVFEEPDVSKSVVVRMDGRISLPLGGEFMAAGCTPASLAEKITGRLGKFVEDANVSVILLQSNSKVYYILGQIKTPGEYSITHPITVLQAIARAGGLLEWAKKSGIMIVSRPDAPEKITYFDYGEYLNGTGQNVVINPGDTIVIP